MTPSQPASQAPPRDKQLSQPSLIPARTERGPDAYQSSASRRSRAKRNLRFAWTRRSQGARLPQNRRLPAETPFPRKISRSLHATSSLQIRSRRRLSRRRKARRSGLRTQRHRVRDESVEMRIRSTGCRPAASGAPMGAPMMAGAGRGNGAGVAGGVAAGAIALDSDKAKQQRIATNGRREPAEILTATQEQLSASFVVRTPDKSVLWRIGNAGFIERSGDAGLTWSGTLPKQNAHYAAGSAPSAKVCWLVGNDGISLSDSRRGELANDSATNADKLRRRRGARRMDRDSDDGRWPRNSQPPTRARAGPPQSSHGFRRQSTQTAPHRSNLEALSHRRLTMSSRKTRIFSSRARQKLAPSCCWRPLPEN